MIGTFLNVITVLIGGALGMLFGARVPARVLQTIVAGLGLFTIAIGIQLTLSAENAIVVLGSLLLGGLAGEWLRIEDRLQGLGRWLEKRFAQPAEESSAGGSRFVRGFLTASLVFCIGPMTILGSINDGLRGDYQLLAIKSVLDGFAALAFASSLGVGVLFSALIVLGYQGGLTLLAAQVNQFVNEAMMNEMTAVGGVMLLGIGISSLLEIKPIRTANFLPGLLFAPLIVAILQALGLA